jgi:hypothetical protein
MSNSHPYKQNTQTLANFMSQKEIHATPTNTRLESLVIAGGKIDLEIVRLVFVSISLGMEKSVSQSLPVSAGGLHRHPAALIRVYGLCTRKDIILLLQGIIYSILDWGMLFVAFSVRFLWWHKSYEKLSLP